MYPLELKVSLIPNENFINEWLNWYFLVHNESNHFVISTDYRHYSIVNYCHKIDDDKYSDALWVLSPHRKLDADSKMIVDDIIGKYFVKGQLLSVEQDELKCQ